MRRYIAANIRCTICVSFLSCVIYFNGCQTKELSGQYTKNDIYEIYYNLDLFEDSTFQYIEHTGLYLDTIKGNWKKLRHNRIILVPDKMKNYYLESSCDTCDGKFIIRIYGQPENYPLPAPIVRVYNRGSLIYERITNSLDSRTVQNADSIQISYIGYEPFMFTPKYRKDVMVDIFLILEQQKLSQEDMIFEIRKNKLRLKHSIVLRRFVR